MIPELLLGLTDTGCIGNITDFDVSVRNVTTNTITLEEGELKEQS